MNQSRLHEAHQLAQKASDALIADDVFSNRRAITDLTLAVQLLIMGLVESRDE